MLEGLKEKVLSANQSLSKYGLVTFTWGNVSGISREEGLVVIKPSGVSYEELTTEDMSVVDMEGNIVEGKLKPSSDTPTHLVLYKNFPEIGGVVHTHSTWATSFAQAGEGIPALGTTHADYFYGEIPCTRPMKRNEIQTNYEEETGHVIVEEFVENNIDPNRVPGVMVHKHAPFSWGKDPEEAIHNAVVMEEVAKIAWLSKGIDQNVQSMSSTLLDKHYLRKHGKEAYYGQTNQEG
ncbi:L-ribulose-5-phosphate 4-epimerase [Halobacillus halophilus]|uniref:L-ribulose-5-phosphate 4-epimerase n=1 Tax=Halobacillus halophilus TaxID=1570 RepID=UPI001CD4BC6A|nr:L-ribulose-5-phosphate 4-epimerase [Halobacillus halophilus]MCA1011429.1 L-ribulose-5-phosphate 4-epimerase [Halobacillus halophilus]